MSDYISTDPNAGLDDEYLSTDPDAGLKQEKKRQDVPKMSVGSVAQDLVSGVLQIGPTAVKGVADITRLATGDRLGKDTSEAMKRGITSIQDVFGSDRAAAQRQNFEADMADESVNAWDTIKNNKGALADMALPTVGSMFLPVGVAGAAGKVATIGKAAQAMQKAALADRVAKVQKVAGIGTIAAQNAAETFVDLIENGTPMEDAYIAAGITVPFSVVAGVLTGGGAEGAITRAMTRTGAVKTGVAQTLKASGREGAQEVGEELGQITGKAVATGEAPTPNSALKQLSVAGTLGAVMGGGVDVASQLDGFGKPITSAPSQEANPPQNQVGSVPTVTQPAPVPTQSPIVQAAPVQPVKPEERIAEIIGEDAALSERQMSLDSSPDSEIERLDILLRRDELAQEYADLNAPVSTVPSGTPVVSGQPVNSIPSDRIAQSRDQAATPAERQAIEQEMQRRGITGETNGATDQGGQVSPVAAQGIEGASADVPGSGSDSQADVSGGVAGGSGGTGVSVGADGSPVPAGPTSAPGVNPEFDVSGRTDEQLANLVKAGKPGWREAAIAEVARRNPVTTPATPLQESAPAPVTQQSASLTGEQIAPKPEPLAQTQGQAQGAEGKTRPYADSDTREAAIDRLKQIADDRGLNSQRDIRESAEYGASEAEIQSAIERGEDALEELANTAFKRNNGLKQGFGPGNNDAALRANLKPLSEREKTVESLLGRGLYELSEADRARLLKSAKVKSVDAFEDIARADRKAIIEKWLDAQVTPSAESKRDQPSAETLADLGLYRKYGDKHQYRIASNDGTVSGGWFTSNSMDGAIEMATKAHDRMPPESRLTRAQRDAKADAEYDAESERRYGKLTTDQLRSEVDRLTGEIASLQKAGKREFNGNGGRRTSAAVSNEGARMAGEEKMRLERLIKQREATEVSTFDQRFPNIKAAEKVIKERGLKQVAVFKDGDQYRIGAKASNKQAPSDNLIQRIKQLGGIHTRYRNDVIGDKTGAPGLFSNTGKGLDDLATELKADGFDIDTDTVDGGVEILTGMIQRAAIMGETILNFEGQERAAQKSQETDYRDRLKDEIDRAGGTYRKNSTTKQLEATVEELRAKEAMIEREAIQSDISLSNDLSNEINAKTTTGDDAMLALGFTEDEINEVNANNRKNQEAAKGPAEEGSGTRVAQGQDQDFGLTGETAEEVKAREEAQAAKAKAEQEAADKAEAEAKKKRIDAEVASRQKASAENFVLGQNAEDAIAGQGDIFSQAQPVANEVDKPALFEELRSKLGALADRAMDAGNGALSGRLRGFTIGMKEDDTNLTREWVDDVVASREKMVVAEEKKAGKTKQPDKSVNAPGTRINGEAERAASDRLEQLHEQMSNITNRNSREGNAKAAIRSVIEELRKPRTVVSIIPVLDGAANAMDKNYSAFADVIREVMDTLEAKPAEDLGSMFDNILAEEVAKDEAKKPTVSQSAKSASKNTAAGIDATIDALGALFGGKGRLSSGLTFDEETYAKAKPLFAQAIAHFKDAGQDAAEAMRAVVRMVLDRFGAKVATDMKPYVVRFIDDVRKDAILEQRGDGNANTLQTQQLPEGDTGQAQQDAAAGNRDSQSLDAGMAASGQSSDRGGALPGINSGTGADGARGVESAGQQPSGAARNNSGVRSEPVAADDHVVDGEELGKGGLTKKYRDNVSAIKILKTIEAEGRVATADERKTLAKYVGWGAMKGPFDPDNKAWAKQHAELKSLLTDDEFRAARASTLDAHYTSPVAVGAMYEAIARLGFKSGRILEPSVGIGNFFGLMPREMRSASKLHGVELDSLTSRLVAALYPKSKIAKATGFQDYDIPSEYFDLVIGNPPFGSHTIVDMVRSLYSGFNTHGYFLAKSIDKLRPGGIMAVVVSHNFLDAQDGRVRKFIGERASLLGGVRLPNTAFKENAGTEVVTDILIFQKHDKNGLPTSFDFMNVVDQVNINPKTGENATHKVNQFFVSMPQFVLGKPSAGGSMYGANEYTVEQNGDIKELLSKWVKTLPENVFDNIDRARDSAVVDMAIPEGVKVGSYFVDGSNRIMRRGEDVMGNKTANAWEPRNATQSERMKGMIAIRDALRQQMRLERSLDATEQEIEANRANLNKVYDDFIKKFKHLNNTTNRGIFLDDTESNLIQGLEFDYDRGVGKTAAENEGIEPREAKAIKADIFNRRVAFPPNDFMTVSTAKDALLASLNYRGKVDPAYMAEVYGKPMSEIVEELGDVVFDDPQSGIVTADDYLSGDVKTKLDEAKSAAQDNAKYRRNVEALEKIIPKDKTPSEISVSIGASFVPAEIYQQFAKHISGATASANYVKTTGQWLIAFDGGSDPALNTGRFGTSDLSAQALLQLSLMGRGAIVKQTTRNPDGSTTTIVLEKQTEAAREKQNAIKAEWKKWLWQDPDRATNIAAIYNDKMNRIVERAYDGAHMTFPGMNPSIPLLEHQKNGVWRGLQSYQVLYDHVVGAGKTFVMAALAMEMRRTGIARKPMFVVPNHLTLQWRSEFTRLYPGSNILAATPEDFSKDNRERLFAKIITGDWDAVVIGHSSLKKIGLPVKTEMSVLQEQIDELADAIEDMKRARGDKRITADMEKIRKNLEAKMKDKLAAIGKRSKMVTFDELGIDALFVDEMHEFKNLTYNTTMDRNAGMGNPAGSSKAFDMFVKTRWLFDTFDDKTPFVTATGTPVSNSLVEMFNMQRYMQYPTLKKQGLHVFDAWAKQFGSVENVYEVAPSGSGYRQSTRFAKFTNLPALMSLYNSFADTITLDDLKAQEEAQGKRFPVPKMVGGRPVLVVAQRSPSVAALMGIPKAQTDDAGNILFGADLDAEIKVEQDDKTGKWSAKIGDVHLGHFETAEDARLKIVERALSPVVNVEPESILGRFANLRQLTKETKGKVNALSLTGEANKAGLDYRLIDPAATDFAGSKINLAIGNMMRVYQQWTADKGAQLVFCDLSIPLSARASYTNKPRRLYVREDGAISMKRGTLHAMPGHEDLPFFVVQRGDKDTKRFDAYDAASGMRLKSDFRSKQDAVVAIGEMLNNEAMRVKWINAREATGEIEQGEIDEYNNDNDVEVDDAAMFFTREDIAGMSGSAKFSVYDDIKAKLIAKGVPEHEIAFIHDYNTPTAKGKLFSAVNDGSVRFLLGSTPKMGAGTNVQKRLVGLHHIDAPWRPSDLEQREGRIIRRGNELYNRDPDGFEVFVGRYATEQTYDTRRWQILEHKARGIEQLRNFDGTVNEIDDIDGEAANSADMKAAASGDPLILEETKLRNDVRRLEQLQAGHADEVLSMTNKARNAQQFADKFGPEKAAQYKALIETVAQHKVDKEGWSPIIVQGGKALNDKDAAHQALTSAFNNVRVHMIDTASVQYRGLDFELAFSQGTVMLNTPTGTVGAWLSTEPFSPSGMVQRLKNYIDRLPAILDDVQADIEKAKRNAVAMQEQAKQPFQQEQDLESAREAHKLVQRKLMAKGPSVPDSQRAALDAGIKKQKARLRELGFGKALDEMESAIRLSRSTQSTSIALRDLKAVVSRVKKTLANLPTVHVLSSPEQLDRADASQASLYDFIAQAGAMNDVEGATHDGEIYLFASGLADEARAEHVLATHEVTHYGLRAVFGTELDTVLQSIWANNASVRKQATALRKRLGLKSNVAAVEEVLADIEPADLVKLKGWRKLVSVVRDWLQNHGFNALAGKLDGMLKSGVTEQQQADMLVADVVNAARDWVKGGKRAGKVGSGTALQRGFAVTGFGLRPDANGEGYDTSVPTQTGPTPSRPGLGADLPASDATVPSLDQATRRDTQIGSGSPAGAESGSSIAKLSTSNTNPDIRFSRNLANLNPLQRAKAKYRQLTSPEAIDKVLYEVQDKYIDLRRLRDHIKKIGGVITDLNDAYLGEELYHKRLAKQTEDFLDNELKPLLAGLREHSISMEDFERFLHARHAPEANAKLAESNPNQQEIDAGQQQARATVKALELQLQTANANGTATRAIDQALKQAREELAQWNGAQAFRGTEAERLSLSGMSDQESAALMAAIPANKRVNYDRLAGMVDTINARTLDTLQRSGLMSKADLDTWRTAYQFYVPLYRDDAHPSDTSHPIGQGFSTRGDAARRRVGSNEQVTNILSHIAMQRESALTRAEKNMVMQKLYLMAKQNPLPDYWKPDAVPMVKVQGKDGFVHTVPDPRYKDSPNILMLRVGGKDVAIEFNKHNPQAFRLAQAMKNLDVDDLHYVIPMIGKGTRWLASVNTQYNPIFGVINFIRDVQGAALNLTTTELAGSERALMKDTIQIMREVLKNYGRMPKTGRWGVEFDELQSVGGTTGYRDLYLTPEDRANKLKDELKALDRGNVKKAAYAVADWLSDYNEAMENAVRLAAYVAAKDKGMTKVRAASLAKNLTVNFNRKGRQTREIGALFAFFNAALQGTKRMHETLSGPAGKKIMAGGVLVGVLNTVIGMAMMGADGDDDDDNWEKIPEFIKERAIIIPTSKEDYITIPMPLGFHFLPNIGRLATEFAMGGDDKTATKQAVSLAVVMADAFNPLGGSAPILQMAMPTVLDPLVALAQNKDWTGKPIYMENYSDLDPDPGYKLTKSTATPWSKAFTELINDVTGGTEYTPGMLSPTPDQVDYIIGQLTGGVGREIGKVAQTVESQFTGDELPPYKIPLVGRLYGNTRGTAGQATAFYENLKKANMMENEIKGRMKDGVGIDEYLAENPNARTVASTGNRYESRVRKLRTRRQDLAKRNAPQEELKAIDDLITDTMKEFNREMSEN